MSWLLFFFFFFFIFRAIGNYVARFLINTGSHGGGRAGQSEFHRIFQEMLNNLHNAQNQRQYGQQSTSNQGNNGGGGSSASSGSRGGSMGRKEALEVLGLSDNATEEDIKNACKKLMMKNHPDTGGSSYIFRQILDAKKVLLGNK